MRGLRVALAAVVVLASGCGAASTSATAPTDSSAAAAPVDPPTMTDPATSTAPPSDEPVEEPTTGATETAAQESGPGLSDPCALIPADALGAIVGAPVTVAPSPGGGCEFSQEDARALSGSVGIVPHSDTNGGFDAALAGSRAVLTDAQDHPLSGIGDRAQLVTGTYAGGTNLQLSGAAQASGTLVNITLVQAGGLTADALVDVGTRMLTLAVSKL